jgi:hypothetical protein
LEVVEPLHQTLLLTVKELKVVHQLFQQFHQLVVEVVELELTLVLVV